MPGQPKISHTNDVSFFSPAFHFLRFSVSMLFSFSAFQFLCFSVSLLFSFSVFQLFCFSVYLNFSLVCFDTFLCFFVDFATFWNISVHCGNLRYFEVPFGTFCNLLVFFLIQVTIG